MTANNSILQQRQAIHYLNQRIIDFAGTPDAAGFKGKRDALAIADALYDLDVLERKYYNEIVNRIQKTPVIVNDPVVYIPARPIAGQAAGPDGRTDGLQPAPAKGIENIKRRPPVHAGKWLTAGPTDGPTAGPTEAAQAPAPCKVDFSRPVPENTEPIQAPCKSVPVIEFPARPEKVYTPVPVLTVPKNGPTEEERPAVPEIVVKPAESRPSEELENLRDYCKTLAIAAMFN